MSGIDDIEKPVHPPAGPPAEGGSASPQNPGAGGAGDSGAAASGPPAPGASAAPGARQETPGASAPGAPSQQELAIRSALETVMDPEIGLSVVDLGLIREVRIDPGKTLVRMLLTTPFCPYAPQLMADVKQASRSVVDQECEVEILPDAWSPEMMPDPGLLGFSY